MNGPRIYNSANSDIRERILRTKQIKREKEIHRVRRNRIIVIFLSLFAVLGFQVYNKVSQIDRIKQQTQVSKAALIKVDHQNDYLVQQRNNLKDPDYVAKFIRNKFFWSKQNEKIYNLPNGENYR